MGRGWHRLSAGNMQACTVEYPPQHKANVAGLRSAHVSSRARACVLVVNNCLTSSVHPLKCCLISRGSSVAQLLDLPSVRRCLSVPHIQVLNNLMRNSALHLGEVETVCTLVTEPSL